MRDFQDIRKILLWMTDDVLENECKTNLMLMASLYYGRSQKKQMYKIIYSFFSYPGLVRSLGRMLVTCVNMNNQVFSI